MARRSRRTHSAVGIAERKEMIDRNHSLPIKRQAESLSIGRSTVYYRPRPVSDVDLQAMRRIEEPPSQGSLKCIARSVDPISLLHQ